MAVPDCESQNYPEMYSSSYLCYKSDKGYSSPYENIAKVLKMVQSKHFAILYVHDDMLITSALRRKIGKLIGQLPNQFGINLETMNCEYRNCSLFYFLITFGDLLLQEIIMIPKLMVINTIGVEMSSIVQEMWKMSIRNDVDYF